MLQEAEREMDEALGLYAYERPTFDLERYEPKEISLHLAENWDAHTYSTYARCNDPILEYQKCVGVTLVHHVIAGMRPKLAPGNVRFGLPATTGGKNDFDNTQPNVFRGAHNSLCTQFVRYLCRYGYMLGALPCSHMTQSSICRKYCPLITFLVISRYITYVDFYTENLDIGTILAKNMVFKYKGRKLSYIGHNLPSENQE